MTLTNDIAIIGAGAAGLAAAIFAAEASRGKRRIVLLEGARKPGAKILVSGGGRCNVTNQRVTPEDYHGGSRNSIRKVLKAFGEARTIEWFASLGVELELEETGKYFPVSNSARSILDALLDRARELNVELRCGVRVAGIAHDPTGNGFRLSMADGTAVLTRRLILATGGRSLPKSGSDGASYAWLKALGHTINATTPALAPLVLRAGTEPGGRFAEFAGLSFPARLHLLSEGAAPVQSCDGELLFTHFGISGPLPMDFSRHLLQARLREPARLWRVALSHPDFRIVEDADQWLLRQASAHPARHCATAISELYPERFARVLAEGFGELGRLTRERRRELATRLARLPLDVAGDRGWSFAETTAGGVELAEVDVRNMASRIAPGLHLCGEVLDVDGRIGGFNFQWAWATGYLAGRGAVEALAKQAEDVTTA